MRLLSQPKKVINKGRVSYFPFLFQMNYPDYRPLISADESMLIFTSRRKSTTDGKISEYDLKYFENIYVSYNVDGKWIKAENPGKPLNSVDHDAAVGISPDGRTLYFSSQGHSSMGGFDIFKSVMNDDGTWGKPGSS